MENYIERMGATGGSNENVEPNVVLIDVNQDDIPMEAAGSSNEMESGLPHGDIGPSGGKF